MCSGHSRILRIRAGVVNLVSLILMRDRKAHIGTNQLPFDLKLLKNSVFVPVQIYSFLFSLTDYANYVGLTSRQGSTIGAMLAIGTFLGRHF